MKKIKILFVCSSGYRAELACNPFKSNKNIESRNCGVYSTSKDKLIEDISWADKIVCITSMHYEIIKNNFKVDKEKLINLNLSDYASQDEIISVSKEKVSKEIK